MLKIYKGVFIGAIVSIYEARATFLRVLVLPILCVTLIGVIEQISSGGVTSFVVQIINLYFYTVMAVATHRLVLLGTEAVSILGIFRWGKRELRFALYVVLLILVLMILGALLFFLGVAINFQGSMLVLLIIYGIVGSRFSLVFPAIAIDAPSSFDDSWNMSRGHSLLMLCVVGVAPIVFMYPVLILEAQEQNLPILSNLTGSVVLVLEITLLSCAYNEIQKSRNTR